MSSDAGTTERCAVFVGITIGLLLVSGSVAADQPAVGLATHLLEEAHLSKGICCVPRCGTGELALALAHNSDMLVHAMDVRSENVAAIQERADEAGLLGRQLYAERGDVSAIPLADNCVDLLVITDLCDADLDKVPQKEIMRVLAPCLGRAIVGAARESGGNLSEPTLKQWVKGCGVPDVRIERDNHGLWAYIHKPLLEGADDWSHPYHGPDNNPQSTDRVAVAPYLTQFMADPRYAPIPQVAVASAGRVFKAFGHVAFKKREEPFLNKLVAFNGYNGTMLWQRDLAENVMIHRNTIVAMPDRLYVGDDTSCKVIDTATGRLIDEIIPPTEIAGGTFWKWMAIENGILYAVTGEQEQRDPTKRWQFERHGWPWDQISEGFTQAENPWGFGRTVLAIDPEKKEVLWSHREAEPIDCRAICMSNGRIYAFRFGAYLVCLDAKTGSEMWRKTPENAPELFESLGEYLDRQDWQTNWRTVCYLKCSDKALYFAGPQIGKLLAVSAEDGTVMWENAYDNFQLVLRDNDLYGISGETDERPSMKLAALSGDVIEEIDKVRRACTRPTGSADAVFFRGGGGSVRLDLASNRLQWISPMRPNCHDGVTIANGLLYWWPSVCDCQQSLYGITSLGPARDFEFNTQATEPERLEKTGKAPEDTERFTVGSHDWPTFRADNTCSASTEASVRRKAVQRWHFTPTSAPSEAVPPVTAPVAAGGLVFFSGPDGVVRALDAATGELRWNAYTGGAVRLPPTIWNGRAFVGSGDGWVYALDAGTGRLLWRFRAAPAERKIPVYGSLLSTWPAASGVLVDGDTAYVAAGIVNYDGTYVYALDAETGHIKWQNNSSGHLDRDARTGISVQGHLLLHDGKLYMSGGTSISPGIYDTATGACLNDPEPLKLCASIFPRGWELTLLGDRVIPCGKPFYAHPRYEVYDDTVFNKIFLAPQGDRDIVWVSNQHSKQLICIDRLDRRMLAKLGEDGAARPGESAPNLEVGILGLRGEPLWERPCRGSTAVAVGSNAVVFADESQVTALDLKDGSTLWSQPIPSPAVTWGLAIDRDGRVIATLEDGSVVCFG